MSLLQICADALSLQRPEPLITREALGELRKNVAEFVDLVGQIDLPPDAKTFLMKHAEIIDNALIDYILQGYSALTAGVERAVGHAALYRRDVQEWSNNKPEPFARARALLTTYLMLLAALGGTDKLLEDLHIFPSTHTITHVGDNGPRGADSQKNSEQ